jgi:type IV fimbrial biogenesis protein FimT
MSEFNDSNRIGAYRPECGFTLIELMVTIAVAAILIAIAVPSFKNLTVSNALTTAANDMVGALNLARMESIKLNSTTQFCGSTSSTNGTDTLGAACGTQKSGAVYMLQNATGATATQVRDAAMGIQNQVQLASAGITGVRFGGQGLGYQASTASTSTAPYSGTVADICSTMISSNNHRLVSIATGSIITVTTSTGSCP